MAKTPDQTAHLHIPIGIPGCGKSTEATRLNRGSYGNLLEVVSTDDIRRDLFGSLEASHSKDRDVEQQNNANVFTAFHARIELLLRDRKNVFADATNLDTSARRSLRNIAKRVGGVRTIAHVFTDLPKAYAQNYARLNGDNDSFVPEHVLDSMSLKLILAVCLIPSENYYRLRWHGPSPEDF